MLDTIESPTTTNGPCGKIVFLQSAVYMVNNGLLISAFAANTDGKSLRWSEKWKFEYPLFRDNWQAPSAVGGQFGMRESPGTGGMVRFDSTRFGPVLFVFLTCSEPMGKVRQWQAGNKLVPAVVCLSPRWRGGGHGSAVSQPGMLAHDHLPCRQKCVCALVCLFVRVCSSV